MCVDVPVAVVDDVAVCVPVAVPVAVLVFVLLVEGDEPTESAADADVVTEGD